MRGTENCTRAALLSLACIGLPACASCGSSSGQPDSGTDTGLDTDTSWDGGPLTPCEGDAEPGEVCVPGGRYLWGCMPYDEECRNYEQPMVEVTLSPFWIDQMEATNAELLDFLNSLPEESFLKEPGSVKTADDELMWVNRDAPVCFSPEGEYFWCTDGCTLRDEDAAGGSLAWLGAKLYCEWRGKRLPTEAEWEAAARGQTKWIYPCAWWFEPCSWGDYDCCHQGDECFHSSCEDCCIPFAEGFNGSCDSPNGVHAMYGNAAEWVLNGRENGEAHEFCADGCTDPAPWPLGLHYLKGGGVGSDADTTRNSARYYPDLDSGNNFTGVRCVRSPVSFGQPYDWDAGPDAGPDAGLDGGK